MKYLDLLKKYNLYYTNLTNQTLLEGVDEYPTLPCELETSPNYLCLYGEVKDYFKTNLTCVCFYQYDNKFDGIHGLFNAIYYDNEKLLRFYKERFKNVKMVIEPDYSQVRDIEIIENKYRQFKARIVGLWFLLELKIPVIPNINYANKYSFEYMTDGIHHAKMLAISLKGIMGKSDEERLLVEAIRNAVDNTEVKKFIVYTTGIIDSKVDEYFKYAKENNIEYVIPDNSMRIRNRMLNDRNLK